MYVKQSLMKFIFFGDICYFCKIWAGPSEKYSAEQALHVEVSIAFLTVVGCVLIMFMAEGQIKEVVASGQGW